MITLENHVIQLRTVAVLMRSATQTMYTKCKMEYLIMMRNIFLHYVFAVVIVIAVIFLTSVCASGIRYVIKENDQTVFLS